MPHADAYYRPVPVYDLFWYRDALGLTQEQCARACGLSVTHYQKLEQGKCNASRATLRKLSAGLHVPQSLLRRKVQP